MKKVKLMLLSLSVLAVVGGALAFTAKNGPRYCTALPEANGACPVECPDPAAIVPTTEAKFVCTTIPVVNGADECHFKDGVTTTCLSQSFRSTVEQ